MFSFEQIVGSSPALRAALDAARKISRAKLSMVLLVGETGTGKELVARAIHERAAPRTAFVAVNCAAIPATLLETELFGHERAPSPAPPASARPVRGADGGTLFLDEIGELPPAAPAQAPARPRGATIRRSARARQRRRAHRRGDHGSLAGAAKRGELPRGPPLPLNVVPASCRHCATPREDVVPLFFEFLAPGIRAARRAPGAHRGQANRSVVAVYDWPLNVRELRNVMERAAVLSGEDDEVRAAHLLIQQRTSRSAVSNAGDWRMGSIDIPPGGKTLATIEREAALLTLQLAKGNRTHCARILGISRPTLSRILRDAAAPVRRSRRSMLRLKRPHSFACSFSRSRSSLPRISRRSHRAVRRAGRPGCSPSARMG